MEQPICHPTNTYQDHQAKAKSCSHPKFCAPNAKFTFLQENPQKFKKEKLKKNKKKKKN